MNRIIGLSLLTVCAFAQQQQSRTTRHSFSFPAPGETRRIEIDNIWGSIRVTGYDGTTAEAEVVESVRAESNERAEAARREVRLDVTQKGNTVLLYVDGPFRCRCDEGFSSRGWRDRDYRVRYDLTLRVPRDTFLWLRTVNEGEIHVDDTTGDYDIKNINGGVEMNGVSGSGRAYALNKPLKVTFRTNPRSASYFGSLNGKVDLYFRPNLSADFRMKTFNGKIYSDFEMTALPRLAVREEREGGRRIFRADRYTRGRVGAGGIEIELDGFNGEMAIHKLEAQ
ncbi:MAG: hypothetical protein ACRD8O_02265 [Bryobacteraceae bacterium]